MGLFSKIFGPSFEQRCDKLALSVEFIFSESDRVCEGLVTVYNEDVLLGLRGADRQSVELTQDTLLSWKCIGLVPLFVDLIKLHPSEKERAWKIVEVLIAGLNNRHPAAAKENIKDNDDFGPYKLLATQFMFSDSSILVPLSHDHIVSQYKKALSKLKGRAEDVSDLISRYEQSNTILTNAVTVLALPNKIL